MSDPNDLLGVAPGATPAEVTAAFRRFALRNHPDRGGDPDRFRAGADAYRRLVGRAPSTAGAHRGEVMFHRRRRPMGALLRRLSDARGVARPRP
ncbi:MAG: J domain-containing protein [Actinomycetota bacterium]|nr:J domain-containing protein [Actinomycetota bacterium]